MADPQPPEHGQQQLVKCVVWDLDHTIWDGVLLEDTDVALRPRVKEVVSALDDRGILHSIASRNDHATALAALERFGLREYFLCPQINWGAKSASIQAIAQKLNLGLDSFAFVDDDEFERAEVAHSLPAVRCLDSKDLAVLLTHPDMTPTSVTSDARARRLMYQAAQAREEDESRFEGPKEAFLATLDMRMRIAAAVSDDLLRAEELIVRTHQLNTSGRTYSWSQLDAFRTSPRHDLLIARLDDRYGSYGAIGLAVMERDAAVWTIKLLLMSCRVMNRGAGSVLINCIKNRARAAGARLIAEFVPNGRNRMMYVTYKFSGFAEIDRHDEVVLMEGDLSQAAPFPSYMHVEVDVEPPG